jgi:predicted RNA binding protein YcfA (HicA-like mRNA interferase family)
MPHSLKNVSLSEFRKFLLFKGLKNIRNKGGHEVWSRNDLRRPVVLQSHISPIPEFIIKNNLRAIGSTPEDLMKFLSN